MIELICIPFNINLLIQQTKESALNPIRQTCSVLNPAAKMTHTVVNSVYYTLGWYQEYTQQYTIHCVYTTSRTVCPAEQSQRDGGGVGRACTLSCGRRDTQTEPGRCQASSSTCALTCTPISGEKHNIFFTGQYPRRLTSLREFHGKFT